MHVGTHHWHDCCSQYSRAAYERSSARQISWLTTKYARQFEGHAQTAKRTTVSAGIEKGRKMELDSIASLFGVGATVVSFDHAHASNTGSPSSAGRMAARLAGRLPTLGC